MNSAEQILEKFRESDALLDGHFIARAIAERLAAEKFDTVASPAIGGLVIGYETARALNVRFIWTERQEGEMTLRRGFSVKEGERILVVEDVITTGGSTRECIAALESHGARVAAAASIIDRSGGAADVGVPRIALATLEVPTYTPEDCPMCHRGIEAVKPGSRQKN
jgi:orotate phosphoribosyltransferase